MKCSVCSLSFRLSPRPSHSTHHTVLPHQTATPAAPDLADDPLAGRASPTLFVGSLAKSVQEKDVLTLFLPFGKIVDIAFFWHMHGPRKGEPKGYCFLTFAHTEDATAAIKALNDVRLHGRAIAVRYQRDADEGGNGARSMVFKARAKSIQQGGRRDGRGVGGEGKDNRTEGSRAAAAGVASVALPKRSKLASTAAAERGGNGGREGEEEESALEAKIRMLRFQIAASSGGGGGGRG